jgi:hypothetical protein
LKWTPSNNGITLSLNGSDVGTLYWDYLANDDNYHLVHIIITSESRLCLQVDDSIIYTAASTFQFPASTGDFYICGVGTGDSPEYLMVSMMNIYDHAFSRQECVSEYHGFEVVFRP